MSGETDAEARLEHLRRRFADGIEPTDEELLELLADRQPVVIWAQVKDRRQRGRGTVKTDGGSVPATPKELRRLIRRLAGAQAGAPAGTGLTDEGLIDWMADRIHEGHDEPTQQVAADGLGKSVDRVRQVARGYGGWERCLTEARRRARRRP